MHEDARAVAGVRFATARAAVVEVDQNLERLGDDVVRLPALDVDDEADAARVVLELRIVKALFCGRAEPHVFVQILVVASDVHCFRYAVRLNRFKITILVCTGFVNRQQ